MRTVTTKKNLPVRVTGLMIAGAAVLAVLASTARAGAHAAASCWRTVSAPATPAGDSGNVLGVSMSGPASGWAVGFRLRRNPEANFHPLLARWNGRGWQEARLPAGIGTGRLQGVTALSASNVWVVGEADKTAATAMPLIIHWNGHQWSRAHAASVPGDTFTTLLGVAAGSSSDAWAVGEAESSTGRLRTVTEHWNGRIWTLVPSPSLGRLSALSGVAVTSDHRAWAVGGSFAPTSRPLVLHWTGHAWQLAAAPRAVDPDLNSVVAVSPSQVWAVGTAGPRRAVPYSLHWNGHAWRPVPMPAGPARDGRQMISVTALPGGHLAAVGDSFAPPQGGAVYARWNGSRWSATTGPVNGTALAAITSSGHTLWAVGSKTVSSSRFVPLVQRCQL